jgi:hypothetical protein
MSRVYGVEDKIINEYAAAGRMIIARVNRSSRRKPAPVAFYPPQIPHDLGWNPNRRAI